MSRWQRLERERGDVRPKALGGDRRSGLQLRRAAALLQAARHHAQKKTAHAAEQDRPDVLKKRAAWFKGQVVLDPERLVVIDETWASTNMARRHGRCRRSERYRVGVPHGHRKTTTVVGALTLRGLVVPLVLDGPINREVFETYIEKVPVPDLWPGDVEIMDNLSSHTGDKVRELIESAGATLRFLPLRSSNFNPIENAFAKLKALLRKAGERTVTDLWSTIGRLVDQFTPIECRNYFAAAGYDAT